MFKSKEIKFGASSQNKNDPKASEDTHPPTYFDSGEEEVNDSNCIDGEAKAEFSVPLFKRRDEKEVRDFKQTKVYQNLTRKQQQHIDEHGLAPDYLRYTPNPTGKLFHLSKAKFKMIYGGINSGKTTACIWEVILRTLRSPACKDGKKKCRVYVIKDQVKTIKSTILNNIYEVLGRSSLIESSTGGNMHKVLYDKENFRIARYNPDDPSNPIVEEHNLWIEFVILGTTRHTVATDTRGANATVVWINEATEVDRECFEQLVGRIARFPTAHDLAPGVSLKEAVAHSGVILDTNPKNYGNWTYKDFLMHDVVKYPNEYAAFKTKSPIYEDGDNTEYADISFLKAALNSASVSEMYKRNMILGEYVPDVPDGFVIYEGHFKQGIHVSPKVVPQSGIPVSIGYDPGLTGAAVFCSVLKDGTIYVLDEVVTPDGSAMPNVEFLAKLRHTYTTRYQKHHVGGVPRIFCDPAAKNREASSGRSTLDYIRNAGFMCEPVGHNVVSERIEVVRRFLMSGKLFISPNCKTLINGFLEGYRRDKTYSKFNDEYKVLKNHYSHVHDALQYFVLAVDYGMDATAAMRFATLDPTTYEFIA